MPNDDEKLVKAIGRWLGVLILTTSTAALFLAGRPDIAMYLGFGVVWFILITGD